MCPAKTACADIFAGRLRIYLITKILRNMLKRFFLSMLGTIAGIWVSVLLVFFCGMLLVTGMIAQSGDSAAKVESRSILYFDLSGTIEDRQQKQDFFTMIQNIDNNAPTLEEMIKSLQYAADDDDIEGLYLNCSGSAMGMASRQELIEAINVFKESGKWVTAYADNYSQGDYIIATTADSLFLNPIGAIDIHGLGGSVPFYKGLLDKIGVKMQIIKVGTFKSAVEPYILTSMSEPARLQMQQYCDTLWSYAVETIADGRGVAADSIRALAPQMIFTRTADTFIADRLADNLLYDRQVKDYLRTLTNIDSDKELRFITPGDYLSAQTSTAFSADRNHIAVYYALGEISDSGKEGIVGPTMSEDIVKLADDKNVRGLVLRVNSPGGSAFASEQIWAALDYFKSKNKPLYVSMGDYAASGGYYISCGADSIFADRTTITGSIGVFGMIPDISGLVTDKFGVNFSTVQTNANAVGIDVTQAMTPLQYAAMQQSVENIYDLFTKRVAQGRGMEQADVKAIAEGRVWVGSKAIELGLVDRLGSLDVTIAAMADELGMDCDEVVSYPRTDRKLWEKLLLESGSLDDFDMTVPYDGETLQTLRVINRLSNANPMQARMEDLIIK